MTTEHTRKNEAAKHMNPEHSGMRTGNPQLKEERKPGGARSGSADAPDRAGDRPGNAGSDAGSAPRRPSSR
ncbi:MAG TPA: hypothetical protein VNT30_01470 [Stellaceae bacterium]|nr:hypothetical protein [Stellaceae bacterium]